MSNGTTSNPWVRIADVLLRQPVRQWVLSLPFALRYLLATRLEVVTQASRRRPRNGTAHLTRFHGVFAPASPNRARVVPRTRAAAANKANGCSEAAATDRQRALTWAQRLNRVLATPRGAFS